MIHINDTYILKVTSGLNVLWILFKHSEFSSIKEKKKTLFKHIFKTVTKMTQNICHKFQYLEQSVFIPSCYLYSLKFPFTAKKTSGALPGKALYNDGPRTAGPIAQGTTAPSV